MSQRTRSRRSSRSPEHKLDMGNNGCGTSLLWLLWLEISLRQWKNLLDLDANFNCSKPSPLPGVSTTVVTGKSCYHLEHRLHLLCALFIALRKLRCSIQISIQRNWQSNQSSSNTNYYIYYISVLCLMSQRTRSRRSSRSPEHKFDMGNNGIGIALLWLLWLEISLWQWKNLLDLDANFNCSKPSPLPGVSTTVVTGKSSII